MRGTVHIGTNETAMLANAASPFIYRQLFKSDFLKEIQKPEVDADIIAQMGFIMAMQAERSTAECMHLTLDDFYKWLEGFSGGLDLFAAASDIFDIYKENEKTTSDPKGKGV